MRTLRKFVALVRRRRLDQELAEEVETHRTFLGKTAGPAAAKLMGNVTLAREGSPESAQAAGRGVKGMRNLGEVAAPGESVVRDLLKMWSFRQLEWIWQDARLALRGLRRSPLFTAVAIASLALGIGANTAIFSFANAILLKHLAVPHPERLVRPTQFYQRAQSGVVWKLDTVEEVAKQTATVDGLFGWFTRPISFSTGDSSRWVNGEMVTGQYFRTLEVQPAAGRLFNDDDVRNAAGDLVCVLSYAFWQREFGGNADAVGRTILLNGHSYRVLGVTQRGFSGAALEQRFDIAVPATRIGDFMPAFTPAWLKTLSWMTPMARLRPGVTSAQAANEIERLSPDWRNPESHLRRGRELRLEDGSQGFNPMRNSFGKPVVVAMSVVGLVLLAACANLANLLLARSQARAKEFAVRLSIGASRGRLVRQLLVESLLLALGGGAAGIGLAFWIGESLIAFLNSSRSPIYALHLAPDGRVLGFAILLSFFTAVLFGWAPAWHATRPDLAPGLQKEPGMGGPRGRIIVRRGLVVVQIALSVVVVFAAGLLGRTLRTLATVDLGFQPDRVVAMVVDPAADGHSAVEASALYDEILMRARELPEVKAASLAANPPFGSTGLSTSVQMPGLASEPVVNFDSIGPHYFVTLGQSLLRGRDFNERDDENSPRVAIVNENFAQLYLNGRDPIGQKFRQGGVEIEIAGVVRDASEGSVRGGPKATVYLPEKQGQTSGLTLLARTDAPRAVIPALVGIVHRLDRRLPVYSIHTLDTDVRAGLSSERILGFLSTLFAALSTLLAGIGLYGVVAYSVARRRREIGIRFAVGAQRRDVVGLFARESVTLVLIGLAIGIPVALMAARTLQSLLFGVGSGDPVTLIGSSLMLALAAGLAVSVPLAQAARLDPMAALRHD